MTRVEKSFKNLTNGVLGYFIKTVVQFWCRRVFVIFLSQEYLGLNGLFSNILTILSLAELGVGSAISFSLYKPLADNDRETVKSLMALFKRAYLAIGFIVAAVGISLTPFLQHFVKDMPELPHIRLIYVLYVVNSAASYLFTYKRTLVTADQRDYIVSRYSYGCAVMMNLAQLALLYFTRDFLLYLIAMIAFTVIENVLISLKADRLYPYLNEKDTARLPSGELRKIKKNVAALVFHQVGRVLVNGTDNLLIAKMVNLSAVGLYSNYLMVDSAVSTTLGKIYSSIFASIGNVNATETDEVKKQIYDRIVFMSYWAYGLSAICLFCLFNPFIALWLGESFVFPLPTVFVICLNFFVHGYRNPTVTTKNAMGLYWNDRYKPLAEAAVNLGVSILLGMRYGIAGIIWGTVISSMTTNFWVEPLVLYRDGLHAPLGEYYSKYFFFTALTAAAGLITWLLCSLLPAAGFAPFLGKVFICAALPNALFAAVFHKDRDFRYFIGLAKRLAAREKGA